jgi:preprotein translocase subunit SecB
MRAAQISLTNYFVSELEFTTNLAFNGEKPWTIRVEDLDVKKETKPTSEDHRKWEVSLHVKLIERLERNLPYNIALKILGFIGVDESVKNENIERLVEINGASLVFSAAREIVRAITSRGPNGFVLLPTVTFWEPKPLPAPVLEKSENPSTVEPKQAAPAAAT